VIRGARTVQAQPERSGGAKRGPRLDIRTLDYKYPSIPLKFCLLIILLKVLYVQKKRANKGGNPSWLGVKN
jgi:hypothetical protein